MPERTDLRKTLLGLLSEQIGGLYDKDTKTLYVMEQFDLNRALGRVILAHEICHALQDQHFNLSSLPLNAKGNDDLSIAVGSMLEGDATVLMQEYAVETFTGRDLFQLIDVFMIDQSALNRAPEFLRQYLLFPYLSGANFTLQLMYSRPSTRDRVFSSPPVSTEQIIHPSKYSGGDRDEPTSFSLPDIASRLGGKWEMAFENSFGEFQIRALFENWREWETGRAVSEGWGGDRYALCRRGGNYYFAWVSAWDSDEDAKEFFLGISELMRGKRYGEFFGSTAFGGDGKTRLLSQEAEPGVCLRFHLAGKCVLVEIADQVSTVARADSFLEELIASPDAKSLPGASAPADDAASTTLSDVLTSPTE
jgi:hypothetical protein